MLLITLMLMLAISALGLLAVQSAQMDISVTGNERLNRQSHQAAVSALEVGAAMVGSSRDGFWTMMRRTQRAGVTTEPKMSLFTNDFRGLLFLDHEASELTGDAARLAPELELAISEPVDGIRAAGYSDGYCFKRFTFDSRAQLGDDPDQISDNEALFRSSTQAVRARMLLGPLECEGD